MVARSHRQIHSVEDRVTEYLSQGFVSTANTHLQEYVSYTERERERESLITCVVKWKFLVGTIYSCRNTYILYIGPTKTFPFLTG